MEGAYDVAVEESEAAVVVVVEEGAETRFAAGFRPMRVCTRLFDHQLGRPVWGCAYGDRCTFAHSWAELHRKPQPRSSSSPRTFRTEAVVAASGPGGGCRLAVNWRRKGGRGWRRRLRLLLVRR